MNAVITDKKMLSDMRIVMDPTVGTETAARTGGVRCMSLSRLTEADSLLTAADAAAKDLRVWIEECCKVTLEIEPVTDDAPISGCIVVGELPSHKVSAENYGDCRVYADGDNIYIDAADILGLASGASYLASYLGNSGGVITPADISFESHILPREVYEKDAEALPVPYRFTHSVPAERMNTAAKRGTLEEPDGRTFIIAHRGEHKYYPENSLESGISAWRCGADSMEVDIVKSADGVWVCMHDKTLTRTTDAEKYIGKEGYPDSDQLTDWTFAQLRTLRLVDSFGVQTPFIIPTLEEIFTAAKGRMFLHLDKGYNYDNDIFPLMEKMGIYDCVYLCNHIKYDGIVERNMRYIDKGFRLPSMVRTWSPEETEEMLPKIVESGDKMTLASIPRGDYTAYSERDFEMTVKYKGKLRMGAWFIRGFDYEELWREGRARGINIMMTNHPLDIIRLGI